MGKSEENAVKKHLEWEKVKTDYEEHKLIVQKLGAEYETVSGSFKSNKDGFKQLKKILQDCWHHLEEKRKKMEVEAKDKETPPEKRVGLVNLTKEYAERAKKYKAKEQKSAELLQKYTDMRKSVVLAETERMDVDIKLFQDEIRHVRDSIHLAIQSTREPLHLTYLRIMHSEGACVACVSCCAYCCYREPMYGVYEDLRRRVEMLVHKKFLC